MIVRFGYVAMSTMVKNASPSQTMTVTNFNKLSDREAALRKLERIGAENLHNTLRLLFHNRAYDIRLYRFSSKLIPIIGHEMLMDWDPIPLLAKEFAAVGDYVKEHDMRVSFHPDHFTVLSTPKADILQKSMADLDIHVRMLEAMGLDEQARCNVHIGGSYGNKETSMERFLLQFEGLEPRIRRRITLENDDKTFNASETLKACESLKVPMVLDIHHHWVNNDGESAADLWPRIMETWKSTGLPPKIHVSSPKNDKEPRGHADYVNPADLVPFMRSIAANTPKLDVMIEAKMKDEALFHLMKDMRHVEGVTVLGQAAVKVLP
ncbi:MAG TPA: UV DNA damage repair endonuclease UvsE [Bacilli bacterium]